MSARRAVFAVVSTLLLVLPMMTMAARFPDVPGDHPYNSAIEALAIEGVVTGNPDGNYYPARPVNRAEFLTLLYRATRKTPRAASTSCFSDVAATAWYANVVCDAVAEAYVSGYHDGSFKPEQNVNRVEALKMLYRVFGFAVLSGDDVAGSVVEFSDVLPDAWYVRYVNSSYRNGLLPIPGYVGTKFYPANALLRGEAAAYVWRAMNITGDFEHVASSESSSSDASSVETSESSETSEASESSASSISSVRSSTSSASSRSASVMSKGGVTTLQVDFPFSDDGDVDGRATFVYLFPLAKAADVEIQAKLGSGNENGVTCRLFLLGETGLPEEYYVGFEEEASCTLKTSLRAGKYQLEVRPGDRTATYDVFTKFTKSDGNDGFDEAQTLQTGKSVAGQLAVSDVADWYKFTLTQKGSHTVQSFGGDLSCLIYPLADVDLFGFTTPVCGEAYDYPKGSYVVRVQRANGVPKALTYSVQLD